MVQLGKNPPAMQETWARSLGWEDPLEKGKVTRSNILVWRIHKEMNTTERLSLILYREKRSGNRALVGGSVVRGGARTGF